MSKSDIRAIITSNQGELRGVVNAHALLRGTMQSPTRVPFAAILSHTVEEWNAQPRLMSIKDVLYVYTDYRQNEQGQDVPGVKIGDGQSYLIDLPFTVIPITPEDIQRWDNKSNLQVMVDEETNSLVFYSNE